MAVVGQVVRMTLDHGQKMEPMIEVGRLAEFSNIWQTLCYSDFQISREHDQKPVVVTCFEE